MRIIALITIALIIAGCGPTPKPLTESPAAVTTRPAGNGLRCYVAVPEYALSAPPLTLNVVFQNTSDKPLGIIDEWNSWGYSNLEFDYTTADGHRFHMAKGEMNWTMNFFSDTILEPGQMLVHEVKFDPAEWSSIPHPGVILITAVLTQEASNRRIDPAVWFGTVKSPPVRVEVPDVP